MTSTSFRPLRHALAVAALAIGLPATQSQAQVGVNQGLLNPNLATNDELTALPELNDAAVEAIISERPHLEISAFDALLRQHVDAGAIERLYGKLWLPLNLNTASDEEILLIPGMGSRMLHEFEEYRPYVALRQFQREIGKYVNDEELSRLEQYVFVPIDLNTASEQAILSIPGMGNRMLHEFEEYRPYIAIEQFRREIGKYVDEGEVARMERYLVIKSR